MERRSLLAAPLLSAAPDPRRPFYGVWRLKRYEFKNTSTGVVTHPYTEQPEGRLTYDSAGRMSALAAATPTAVGTLVWERD